MQNQKSSQRISTRAVCVVSLIVAVVFVFNAVVPASAAVGINNTINFQGKLVDSNGLNVADGNYSVVFTLYDAASSGSNLWDETQTVSTIDGIFQVALGSVDTTINTVNFNSDQLYLGIKVGADSEMTPRIRFAAVPYAFNSTKVNGLTVTNTSGNPFSSATTFRIADGKTVSINNGLTLAGTDSTTITFQGTDTYVGRATTDTLTNKTIGSTGLTFSGAGTDITSATDEDLTFTPNGTGDLILTSDFNSGVSIGSASNTSAPLSVSGGFGSNAALIVDQRNSGDLFVASQAGTTRFRVANNGDVVLGAGLNANGSVGTGSQCLLGGATASWGTCGSGAGNYWNLANGLLYNGNLSTDFAIGGTTSTSAKFRVSPGSTQSTASVAGSTTFAAMVVDNAGTGDLFTASKGGDTKFVIRNDGTLIAGPDAATSIRNNLVLPSTLAHFSGNVNSYSQVNAQNRSNGGSASTDFIATADNGNDSTNYIDFGINSSGYNDPSFTLVGANDGYLYNNGGNLAIGTQTANRAIKFHTGGTLAANERMRLDGSGLLGINTTNPLAVLDLRGVGTSVLSSTIPIASVSGSTTFAGMVIDNNGTGDIFAASKGGATKFTILNSGDIRISNLTAASCDVKADTTGLLSCGTDLSAAGGTNFIRMANGALSAINDTLDFLIGSNASSSAIFAVEGVNGGQGALGTFQTNAAYPLPEQRNGSSSVTANGYVYVMGGYDNANYESNVTYAKLNSDGSVGSWRAASTMSSLRWEHGSTVVNGYVYAIGGENAGGSLGTVEFAKINADGTLGAWTTTTALPSVTRTAPGVTSANGYIYVIGGHSAGTEANTVYYAKVNPDGRIDSWNTTNTITVARAGIAAVVADGYIFAIGGINNSNAASAVVDAARINADGSLSTWVATTGIPAARGYVSAVVANGYIYSIGGASGATNPYTAQSNVYYGRVQQNGGIAAWSNAPSLPAARMAFPAVTANGYIYVLGGESTNDNFTGAQSTVYYASTARVSLAANLDLIGASTRSLASASGSMSNGSTGGSIFAGNIFSNGSLEVTGSTQLWNGLSVYGQQNITGGLTLAGPGGTTAVASVSGSTSFASMVVNNSGTGDLFAASSSGTGRFVVKQNGNVGIGTDNPLAKLTVNGDVKIESKPNSTFAEQTTWTKVSQTAPGTIASGLTQNIASISASATYNGSIYVGTYGTGTGNAEVYRYDGSTNWTRVSQSTAGTLANSGTTNIGSVSAMTVYDGRLYAGTSKMNQAEVYRFDGGTTWTKVSQPTAGAIKATGTTGIDGVSSMAVFQGRLYAGTRDGAKAELYRYEGGTTWTVMNVTPGTFVPTNTANVNAVTSMVVRNGVMYLGLQKTGDADVVRYTGGQTFLAMNNAGTTGSYNINGTAVTGFDEVTSMVVYNGNVIVGLRKPAAAEVLMMNDTPVASGSAVDTWSRINQTSGQISPGGTTGVDTIGAMNVYNGMLFIGTVDGSTAEIYRYTGGDQKFLRVTQSTPGTIANGGTSGIDGVVNMITSNGDMYIGTMELGRAEVYKYTASVDRSYVLQFHANPQIAGGEQNGFDNHGNIYFLASGSADLSSATANTGAFVFSHGIQTRNGSYDVAEDYPTRDDTLEPGDVVSIDKSEQQFVGKSQHAYEQNVLGVFSEKPALRLSQNDSYIDGARTVPVALAGRVPVKVSTENGEIQSGDYLTASSQPGVAMKATKSGVIFGQAMGTYNEPGIGKITAYIKSGSYQGNVAETFTDFELTAQSSGKDILAALATQEPKEPTAEIVTDTLIAGLRIVSPEVTTKALQVDTLTAASGESIDIALGDEGTMSIKNASGEAGIVFTGNGDAYFGGQVQTEGLNVTGTIITDTLQVNTLSMTPEAWKQAFNSGGLTSLEARIAILETLVASSSATVISTPTATESALTTLLANLPEEPIVTPAPSFDFANLPEVEDATVSGKLIVDRVHVTGSGIVEGMLHVVEVLTARTLIIDDLATFLGNVVFRGDVIFEGRPVFNKDTAGIALVKKGTNKVEVIFTKEYDELPMITANLTLDEITPMPSEELENLTRRQEALEEQALAEDVRFIITKRTAKGFTILLAKPASEDLTFSWIAVSVDNPVVHKGNGDNLAPSTTQDDENVRPISSIPLTITPTSSIKQSEGEKLSAPQEVTAGQLTPPGDSEAREEVSKHDRN